MLSAHGCKKRTTDPRWAGYADGRIVAPLLASDRGASEFDDNPIKPIRLMGEDLVLYKDLSGKFGLVGRHCPHRRADLACGWVEDKGIRCSYHGWLMDETGHCLEQPYEDAVSPNPSKAGCRIAGYPVRELVACSGPLWDRSLRRNCQCGSRLPGRTDFARSC